MIYFIIPQNIFDELKTNTLLGEGGFPFLITGRNGIDGANNVIVTGWSLNCTEIGISKLVIPQGLKYTDKSFKNHQYLVKRVENMQARNSGKKHFTSTASYGYPQTF